MSACAEWKRLGDVRNGQFSLDSSEAMSIVLVLSARHCTAQPGPNAHTCARFFPFITKCRSAPLLS